MSKQHPLTVDEQITYLRKGVVDFLVEDELRRKLERSRKQGVPLNVKVGFDPLPEPTRRLWSGFCDWDEPFFHSHLGLGVEELRTDYARIRLPLRCHLANCSTGRIHASATENVTEPVCTWRSYGSISALMGLIVISAPCAAGVGA